MKQLFQPSAMVFGASITLSCQAYDAMDRWYREFGAEPFDHHPTFLWFPNLLFFASVMLLIGRWWSDLLALLVSARVVYFLGYRSMLGVKNAFDEPTLVWVANRWFAFKYLYQPQELLH